MTQFGYHFIYEKNKQYIHAKVSNLISHIILFCKLTFLKFMYQFKKTGNEQICFIVATTTHLVTKMIVINLVKVSHFRLTRLKSRAIYNKYFIS